MKPPKICDDVSLSSIVFQFSFTVVYGVDGGSKGCVVVDDDLVRP